MAEGRGAGLVGLADKQAGWKEKTGDWYYVISGTGCANGARLG